MTIQKMVDLNLAGQRVLIRQDLNVPIQNGKVTSDARIRASLPTIQSAIAQGAKVILMSHLGRPVEGEYQSELSLAPVADCLSAMLNQPVRLESNYCGKSLAVDDGEVVLLENVRFNPGESDDAPTLAKQYADLCDIFVMDAFGTAHRAQASTHGVGLEAPLTCAGPLLSSELDALGKALKNAARPIVAVIGGSKVSTKFSVLESLTTVVDQLIVGGGIANTFIAAEGHNVGKSLYEKEWVDAARRLTKAALDAGGDIPLPTDVVTATEFSASAYATLKPVDKVDDDSMIFDIGPDTAKAYAEILKGAGTIVWNGPVGVFEFDQFGHGTEVLGKAIAESNAFSIAGGGDTLAAVDKYKLGEKISYISTGGGAFLEFLEGKKLPSVCMLEARGKKPY